MPLNPQSQNQLILNRTFQKAQQRISDELERTGYFTGTLNISVQNGVVRTSKLAIEECEHFQAK